MAKKKKIFQVVDKEILEELNNKRLQVLHSLQPGDCVFYKLTKQSGWFFDVVESKLPQAWVRFAVNFGVSAPHPCDPLHLVKVEQVLKVGDRVRVAAWEYQEATVATVEPLTFQCDGKKEIELSLTDFERGIEVLLSSPTIS